MESKNKELIKDLISRIHINDCVYHEYEDMRIGNLSVWFTLTFDSTHESCKWFTEKINESEEIRYAIIDSLVMRVAEPVDDYMNQIKDDRNRANGGFYADCHLISWDDNKSFWVVDTEFPV